MNPTPDHVHWGVAAYLFSLDLSAGLAALALPGAPWDGLRMATRRAILDNRAAAEAGHPPLMLRDAIRAALGPDTAWRGDGGFFDWVDTHLASVARPRNADDPLLAPLCDPALLARVDAALDLPDDAAESYAALLHSAIDPEASEALLDAVFAADSLIDRKALSDWDRAIIERNAGLHGTESPLTPLIHTLSQHLLIAAAGRVAQGMDPQRAGQVRALCEGREGMA